MKMPPLDQAHRFVRVLLAKCKEREIVLPPIGVAAVFPDTEFEGQPTQGDLEGLVLGARELPYMEELLPGFLGKALPAGHEAPPVTGVDGVPPRALVRELARGHEFFGSLRSRARSGRAAASTR